MSRLDTVLNIEDLRKIARKKLPPPLFNYIDGGADDESNVRGNTRAFEAARLVPEYLIDVSDIDLTTQVLGREIAMPLMLAPPGMNRLFHHDGELAVARAAAAAGFALRPGWVFNYFTHAPAVLANVAHKIPQGSSQSTSLMEYIAKQFDSSVTWDDLEWMISEWGGPFAVKGILSAADARKAVVAGVSAIMVSNHGGRQLDGTLSAFEALAPIADAAAVHKERLLARNEQLSAQNQRYKAQVLTLQEQLNLALARRYAASSEKISPDQYRLFDEAETDSEVEWEDDQIIIPAHTRKKAGVRNCPRACRSCGTG